MFFYVLILPTLLNKNMNTAIVIIGSNYQKESNIAKAKDLLNEHFDISVESKLVLTKAVGKNINEDFLNQALVLHSADSASETIKHFKHIEDQLGRSALTQLQGIIPIDIDLVFWNGVIKRKDIDKYDFVRDCIDEVIARTDIKLL